MHQLARCSSPLTPPCAADACRRFLTAGGVVFSSRNRHRERTPAECLGGCSAAIGCPPAQCLYAGPTFACFTVGRGPGSSADEGRTVEVSPGCTDPTEFAAIAVRSDAGVSHTGVARLRARKGGLCLARTDPAQPRARIVLARCAVDRPDQHWLMGSVVPGGPVHLSDPLNSYHCPTTVVGRPEAVYMAPCGPCSVAAPKARPDGPKRAAPWVARPPLPPGVPSVERKAEGHIEVRMGAGAAVLLDVEDPSTCIGPNATVPCHTDVWGLPSDPALCAGFVGGGQLACAAGDGSGGLRGVECTVNAARSRECVPGTHRVHGGRCRTNGSSGRSCIRTEGEGATVVCTGAACNVTVPGQGYGYGAELLDDGDAPVGYSIVEAAVIQPYNASFTLTSFGPAVVNVTALTELFGAAYEHRLFHRDVDAGLYIWLGTATLAAVAVVGTVLWCVLLNYAEPKVKAE